MRPRTSSAAVLLAPLFGGGVLFAQTVRESVSVEVITVRLTARDKSGKRVEDLKASDLVLKVDGKVASIETFSALPAAFPEAQSPPAATGGPVSPPAVVDRTDPPPARIMIFVDAVDSHPFDRRAVCSELVRYLASPGSADREFRVALYDGKLAMDTEWTRDREAVAASIKLIGAGGKAQRIPGPGTLAAEIGSDDGPGFFSQEWLYLHKSGVAEALLEALAAFPRSPGKGRLLIIGGGTTLMRPGDLAFVQGLSPLTAPLNPVEIRDERAKFRKSPAQTNIDQEHAREIQRAAFQVWSRAVNPRGDELTADDVVAKALERDVEIVPVFTEALGRGEFNLSSKTVDQTPTLSAHTSAASAMIEIAGNTGGEAIAVGRNAASRLNEIDGRAEYLLSFRDPNGDHGQHRITLSCERPGVTIEYRRGYRIPEESERVLDRVVAGLRDSESGADAMNVTITQQATTDSKRRAATKLVLIYTPPRETEAPDERPVSIVAIGADRNGNRTEPVEWTGTAGREGSGGAFRAAMVFDVSPDYEWSVAVRDQPTGLISYVLVSAPAKP